jgi:Tfp pilus assembly protein PilN
MLAAGACVLAVLAAWGLYFSHAAKVENALLADKLNPQIEQMKGFEEKLDAQRREIKNSQERAMPFLQAVNDRDYWLRVIDDMNTRLPERYIWITSFEVGSEAADPKAPAKTAKTGAAIKIRGLYLDNEKQAGVVDDFLQNLAQSPYFAIDLSKRAEVNPVRSTPTSTEWAYEYELRVNLKKPIGAQ